MNLKSDPVHLKKINGYYTVKNITRDIVIVFI